MKKNIMKAAAPSPEAFLEAYTRASLLNQKILAQLKNVLRAFGEHGIEVMILKGADLIFRAYGIKGLRPMNDVDLLVREKDLAGIDGILMALGYRRQIDGNPVYSDPEKSYTLDFITGIWYLEDTGPVWDRALTRELLGVPYQAMCPEDLVVYLTAYVTIHRGFLSPAYAKDLSLILERESVDWPLILDRTLQWNLKIPAYHGFLFAARRGAGIPLEITAALAPITANEKRLLFLFEKLVTPKRIPHLGHFLLWITRPGNRQGAWLQKVFFPPEPMMHDRYGERTEAMYFLLRGWRIVSLLAEALILLARMGMALCKPKSVEA